MTGVSSFIDATNRGMGQTFATPLAVKSVELPLLEILRNFPWRLIVLDQIKSGFL
jgi:hypothetical protein